MDVEFTLTITNKYLKDAQVVSKMEDIDITPIEQERAGDFAVHDDVTNTDGSGTIRRVITATLTPEFLTKYPEFFDRQQAVTKVFQDYFSKQLPGRVTEAFAFI